MRVDGTLDIECASWDRFAVAATHDGHETRVHRTIDALADRLLTAGGCHWAHCGGAYDFLALAEVFRRRGLPCTVDLAGSRISRIVTGSLTLRDSWPLVPLSLALAATIAGERQSDLGLRCRCGHGCGGYCSIRPDDPRASVSEKVSEDARVLYRVLAAIREHAAAIGLELRGTLGATAYATAKKTLELPDCELTPAQWRRAYAGYYGGRVAVVRPRSSGPGTHWDLTSAYPAALASAELPIGEAIEYGGTSARRVLDRDVPGIYECTVTVPFSLLPPLPVRGAERIEYPIGTFPGAWTLPELRAAEARGATIDEVTNAITWEGTAPVFAELIPHWYGFRARAGKATALGAWLRLLCNSLTGKLAERPERRSARLFPAEIKYCVGQRPCSRDHCTGGCGAYQQLDLWGEAWSVPFFRLAPGAHVQWAAYLTASTRETWLRGAESQGEHFVYGDTDSVWTTSRKGPRPQGRELGSWERKGQWRDWHCAGPRAYRYVDLDGGVVVRTAGAPLTDEEWTAGHAETDRGVLPFVAAAQASRGLFRRKRGGWTLPTRGKDTGWYGDRLLDASSGIAYPVHYGEAGEN